MGASAALCLWFFVAVDCVVVCASDFLYACPKCWMDWVWTS